MDENEKKIINKWKASEKYRLIQEALNEKKQDLLNLKINIMKKEDEEKVKLTKKEILQIIQINKDKDNLPSTEFDYSYFEAVGKPDDIRAEYTNKQYAWFSYLVDALYSEDFEFAIELKAAIALEKKQFINLINQHRTDILIKDKTFMKEIENIDVRLYKTIEDNYKL